MEGTGPLVLDRRDLETLVRALLERGYEVIGPVVQEGAIVYAPIRSAEQLPAGWTDEQRPGHYRLRRRTDEAVFGHGVGSHSWKRFLHPPLLSLWRARRTSGNFEIVDEGAAHRYAFLGVRACELAAIARQDRVLMGGPYPDASYRARREAAFLVAVNCIQAGAACFCVSTGTGPRAREGFDVALTEIVGDDHRFLLEVGSARGAELAAALPARPAAAQDLEAAEAAARDADTSMGRRLDTSGLREILYQEQDSPRWQQVAARCLACGNCTMVCPTCFCVAVEDASDLLGTEAERRRRWDSCFTTEFSYIHGGSVRTSVAARYRQWLTHKHASWHDQFGTSGCVGCGRCITWCPAGIDITEELQALRNGAEGGK
jgi:ferredoxin